MVFALTPDEQVVFVRQYRHGAGEEVLELPQGILEDGEDPIAAGARELREETGYESPRLERLSLLLSHPAVQTSRLHVLLAVDAVDGGRCSPEPDEDLEVVLRPLADLEGLVDRGEILASSSVAGIFLALRALARRP